MTIVERSGTFYPVTLALFSALLSFSISKDSSESVIDCSCCSCCCSSETDLTFLNSAFDLVSFSGSWKRPLSFTTIVERNVTFSLMDIALFSAVLSFFFSKNSSESVIESPKRCSDKSLAMSANLEY